MLGFQKNKEMNNKKEIEFEVYYVTKYNKKRFDTIKAENKTDARVKFKCRYSSGNPFFKIINIT